MHRSSFMTLKTKVMKKNWTLIAIITILLMACSTDSEDNAGGEMLATSELVGTWNLTDVRFMEDPNDTSLNLADEIVDRLVEENCVLVSFTFNQDGSVSSSDRLNFIEINAGPNGLDVPCPTESDDLTGTWSLDGNQLTVDDGSGTAETLTVELDGNTLIIPGDDIDPENYAGAEAVFTRQE